jgi:hypothetical protein
VLTVRHPQREFVTEGRTNQTKEMVGIPVV